NVRTGGRPCGEIRFQIELASDERDVRDGHCSVCTKKGIVHLIVPGWRRGCERSLRHAVDTLG
ncbi:MAG: hypothetical protein AB7L28_01850, partial [Kofleriaceae bacterium]